MKYSLAHRSPENCLWIARDIPFPIDAGDRLYSCNLARSVHNAGIQISFLGFETDVSPVAPPEFQGINWISVPGPKKSWLRALFSRWPLSGAIHETAKFKGAVELQLKRDWDIVVIDYYGSGWILPYLDKVASRGDRSPPVIIYVSHNYEYAIWKSLITESKTNSLRRLLLRWNALKVHRLETLLIRRADLVTAITKQDEDQFLRVDHTVKSIVLPPAYSGAVVWARTITSNTPRRVVMIGSYLWVVKEENLRQFVISSGDLFARKGIELHVIGRMSPSLRSALERTSPSVVIHGFVEDPAEIIAGSRLAVVPELIGGGFKLKFLDYIFGRLPIASISQAAECLPPAIGHHVISSLSLTSLAEAIATHIDDLELLNGMQEGAFDAAQHLFNWEDRGQALASAVRRMIAAPSTSPTREAPGTSLSD